MKLEAVDKTNPAVIGIATVAEVDGDRVWIEFDGHEGSGYGTWYWDADLLNAGWCYANRHPLRPPGTLGSLVYAEFVLYSKNLRDDNATTIILRIHKLIYSVYKLHYYQSKTCILQDKMSKLQTFKLKITK